MVDENVIANHMAKLGISRQEAIDLVNADKEIDRLRSLKEVDSDLSTEQKAVVKKMKNSDTKAPTVYKFDTKRARKKDDVKADIIERLAECINGFADSYEVTNDQREIVFVLNGEQYTLTLTKNRKKK